MTNAEIDGFLVDLVARRDEILLKPQSYLRLGQIVATPDRVNRRNAFRAFVASPDGAVHRELRALGIELPKAILNSLSGELSTEASEEPIGASALREEEIADKEKLADSNRARAYISSTF